MSPDTQSEQSNCNPAHTAVSRRALRWLMAALVYPGLLLTTAKAITVLDPDPENSTTLFGWAMANVGDVNGDGVLDIAVGAKYQDSDFDGAGGFGPPQNVGKVWVLSGADLSPLYQLNDPEFQTENLLKFGPQFGSSIAKAGDLNADGISDILVGMPHHVIPGEGSSEDEGFINGGGAILFSGADGSIIRLYEDEDPQESAKMGYAVERLGDVNGDGKNDQIIGVPDKDVGDEEEGGLADVGLAYVYSGKDGSLIRTLTPPDQEGAEENSRFGAALVNTGDLDGDGLNDVAIGAPGASRVYVFNPATGALLYNIRSPKREPNPSFGWAVGGGKDVTGDGTNDIVVGAPLFRKQGAAYVFSGRDGSFVGRLRAAPEELAKFGESVAMADDYTGDGRADILVGAPNHSVNGLDGAGEAFIFNGANRRLFRTLTSAEPTEDAGFGHSLLGVNFGSGQTTVIGVPFQNADIVDQTGDLITHLQIGQIETQ